MEEGLRKIQAGCGKRKALPTQGAQRVARLLGENSRAAKLFEVNVEAGANGRVQPQWKKLEGWREWAPISEGCSHVADWTGEELWRAFIQLTELPTRAGVELRKCSISRPTEHQAILIQRLGLQLPESLEIARL